MQDHNIYKLVLLIGPFLLEELGEFPLLMRETGNAHLFLFPFYLS
jgi:hypothetical protein